MVELTIEEKAKAYDEAIKRAKELLEIGVKDTRDKRVVLSFFPELAECKDERIRKYLITYFSDIDDSASSLKGKDVVAWLEKQGEQKPANKIQLGKKYRCIASPRYSTFVRGFIYKPEDKFLCSLMNFCCDCFEPIEDSEQKSNLYVEIPFGAKDSELQEASYYIPEGFHAEIDGNKVVIKKGGQKPSWSEEDEMQLDAAIHLVSSTGHIETANWLKSLRTQSHWKPSDEQMEYLAKAITTLGNEGDNKTSAILYELRTDLKKLK